MYTVYSPLIPFQQPHHLHRISNLRPTGDGSFIVIRGDEEYILKVVGWAIDPGVTNIVYCVPIGVDGNPIPKEFWTKAIHNERLSNQEYYNQGHIFMENAIKNKWKNRRKLRNTLDAHSREDSLKTMNLSRLRKALRRYFEKHATLWSLLGEPSKWASLRHHVENKKQSVLNNFVNRLVLDSHRQDNTRPYIMIGDGGQTHGFAFKGTRAVPQYMQDLLVREGFQCHEVDEYRTRSVSRLFLSCSMSVMRYLTPPPSRFLSFRSQVCIECNGRLHDVVSSDHLGHKTKHRGLKWCAVCSKYFSRDYIGAFNIGRKGTGPYPIIMQRGTLPVWRCTPLQKVIP